MMKDSIYQEIYNVIEPLLPKDWEKLILYIEYGMASYNMSFYVGRKNNMVKCYNLPDLTEKEILEAYAQIDKIIAPERKGELEKWTNLTMVVEDDGFHVDLDYTDLSQGSYDYKKKWKRKYIDCCE